MIIKLSLRNIALLLISMAVILSGFIYSINHLLLSEQPDQKSAAPTSEIEPSFENDDIKSRYEASLKQKTQDIQPITTTVNKPTAYPSKTTTLNPNQYNVPIDAGTKNVTWPTFNYTPPPSSSSTPSSPKYTYNEAYSLAYNNCTVMLASRNAGNSSAMQSCVAAYMQSYGY